MNIKVFCAWLTRNNYPFKLVNYGDNRYFYNAPGYIYQAADITLAGPDIPAVKKHVKAIEAYCKKYNLDIFNRGHFFLNHITGLYNYSFVIRTPENAAGAKKYYEFRDAAANECEALIHEYHLKGIHKTQAADLEKELKKIMDYYGAMYNRSLIKVVNA